MQAKQKAALYIRVSTEEQAEEGQSAPAQAETLRQYCSAYGIEVYDLYQDLGFSGKRLSDRQGLARLLEDCRLGRFDLVLVWKISRLSRNLKDLLYLIDCFEANDVHFTSCSERFDTSTPVGRMTLQLLGSVAEFERNTIVENVKLGLTEFARKGGKSTTVLGYDNIDKSLVINEAEAGIVKLIFKLYTEGEMSCGAIADHLNSLCCKTKRGYAFRGSSIAYILHNPVYIGINRHRMKKDDSYSIQGQQPAIIDTMLWNKAQAVSASKQKKNYNMHKSGPAEYQVSCAKCHRRLKIFYCEAKGKKYVYYRCSCCSNYVNAVKLQESVNSAIAEALGDMTRRCSIYALLDSKKYLGVKTGCDEAFKLDAEIKKLKKSKERYLSLFEGYKLNDTQAFVERINEIEKRLKVLEQRKSEISSSAATSYKTDSELTVLDKDDARMLSAILVKSIEAYRDNITVVLYL